MWLQFKARFTQLGAVASMRSWCRVSRFVEFILKILLLFLDDVHVDDHIDAGSSEMLEITSVLVQKILSAFGFWISPKECKIGTDGKLLGIQYITSSRGFICVPIPFSGCQ